MRIVRRERAKVESLSRDVLALCKRKSSRTVFLGPNRWMSGRASAHLPNKQAARSYGSYYMDMEARCSTRRPLCIHC